MGDTKAPSPNSNSWFKTESEYLHTIFGKEIEFFIRKFLDTPAQKLLDNFNNALGSPVPYGAGQIKGCLRAVRMIPKSKITQGGMLVAFAYTESGAGGGLDCKDNAYI